MRVTDEPTMDVVEMVLGGKLPEALAGARHLSNVLTGESLAAIDGAIPLSRVPATTPVAILNYGEAPAGS